MPVVWTAVVNCTATGNTLEKDSGGAAWDGGGVSVQTIPAGIDGFVEFISGAPTSAANVYAGLSVGDTDQNIDDVDYACGVYNPGSGPVFYALENLVIAAGPIAVSATGLVTKVERVGTTVRYYYDGTLMYTSALASSGVLLVDCSLYAVGHQVANAIIGGAS